MQNRPVFGGIEAGGTKFVCMIGTGPEDIRARTVIPTTLPEETLARCMAFFQEQGAGKGPLTGLGIASFGPLDLEQGSATFGRITSAPKPGWGGADMLGTVTAALGLPARIHTDVVGAGLGEWLWGAARGKRVAVYVTVGTGIGGGVLVEGRPLDGLLHAEMGHIRVQRPEADLDFPGTCPYHGDCLEGLASGAALRACWGAPFETLPADHPAMEIEAGYIAQLCLAITAMISPQVIVLGGGVMKSPGLLERVRAEARRQFGGYFQSPMLGGDLSGYLVRPDLGDDAGALGALALAQAEDYQSFGRLKAT